MLHSLSVDASKGVKSNNDILLGYAALDQVLTISNSVLLI
jgi:hypothetical protein